MLSREVFRWLAASWEFEHAGKSIKVDVKGPLVVGLGNAADLAVDAAVAGAGIVCLFEEWLQPHFGRGALEPILKDWWPSFPGPFLYFAGRSRLPGPLRAFVDYVKLASAAAS